MILFRKKIKVQRKPNLLAVYLPSLCGGGAERVMLTLANGLSQRGYEVDLVLASNKGPYLKEVDSSVQVIDLKSKRVLTSLLSLISYLRRERPIVLVSAMGYANVIAVLACMLAHVSTRVVVTEHNNLSAFNLNANSMLNRIVKILMIWSYPKADAVVAVSKGVADDLALSINLPRSAISVIYNPFNIDSIVAKSNEAFEHLWLKPNSVPVILGVGRLSSQKDFSILIHAFSCLLQDKEARLLILGEGECLSQLTDLIAELELQNFVDLPGFVDNPYVYMRHASLFVLSSAWEGLPTVLIEAMACGTQVVSTDCPSGPSEILDGGKWGKLIPVGNVSALAEAMSAMLDEREPLNVQLRAAEFNVDNALDQYLKVILPSKDNNQKLN